MTLPPVKEQVSAGGVVVRRRDETIEVCLISVGPSARWQLPKGLIARGETAEEAALREVREETGLVAEIEERLETLDYWFRANDVTGPVRIHKHVHFFLLRFKSGRVTDHDNEVNEARWFTIDQAIDRLAFPGEKKIVALAESRLQTAK